MIILKKENLGIEENVEIRLRRFAKELVTFLPLG